ncbi:MAG: TlyA family RNA methyltransferase [Spirochaetes bacterium]|nr:TlyA family RNA methyltransferase [Spirochaetota bacterium]
MPQPRTRLLDELERRFPDRPVRELAALIIRGLVRVDGEPVRKPGAPVRPGAVFDLPAAEPWVSRGGAKLAAALAAWRFDVRGRVMLDAGSSTGGFTDCLLASGAAVVHCVDVGRGQLAWKLRTDPRVRVHEGVNVMDLGPGELEPPPDRAVADLSFRSLRGAAPMMLSLTLEGLGIFLCKPQFEWKDHPADFRGVVNDPSDLAMILHGLVDDLWDAGAFTRRIVPSPVTGRKGNREFLLLVSDRPGANRTAAFAAVKACLGLLEV